MKGPISSASLEPGEVSAAVNAWLKDMPGPKADTLRVLAKAVDTDSTNAALWRQLQTAIEGLLGDLAGPADGIADIRRRLSSVGDTA